MIKTSKKTTGWPEIRKQLAALDKPALIALVKDLSDSSVANRDFVHARCVADGGDSELLERYRTRIINHFYLDRDGGDLKLGGARKVIRDFWKATGSVPGTAELLLTYVESGVKFTATYGDINERFYSSVESVLSELANLMRKDGGSLYLRLRARLDAVARLTADMGWGFGDFVRDSVRELEEELGT